MKHRIIQLITMAVVPLFGHAQVDDMYFVPKKETKAVQRQHTVPAQTQVRESAETYTLPDTYTPANGNTRDVDEYNRRHRFGEPLPEDTVGTTVEEEGEWVNGFQGSDADYAYTKRILRFYTPSVGIPVSSPLYWDLCYGPNSIYWNVYDDGIYAYAFPSSWNSLYYGPYFSFSWGMASIPFLLGLELPVVRRMVRTMVWTPLASSSDMGRTSSSGRTGRR